MNLVMPLALGSRFFEEKDYIFPKPLIEISGIPMIELVIKNLHIKTNFDKIVFIVRSEDCQNFHLDSILKLTSPIEPIIIKIENHTSGALCSVLMAIDHIDENQLLISNADQIFDGGIGSYISNFEKSSADAGCLTFQSVHPRWSYVDLGEDDQVIEAAEKNPISNNAIAGVYFFKNGFDFLNLSFKTIKQNLNSKNEFFISSIFNQYILNGKYVKAFKINESTYHSFYTPQKIKEYENLILK